MLDRVYSTALHSFGSVTEMAERSELFFGKLEEMIGSPIPTRDPLRPIFVPISDAPEPDVRPGDAEDAMIELLMPIEPEPIVRKSRPRLFVRFF